MKYSTKRDFGTVFELIGIAGLTFGLHHQFCNNLQETQSNPSAYNLLYTICFFGSTWWYVMGSSMKESALIQRIREETEQAKDGRK
jgi:hypothetical protein